MYLGNRQVSIAALGPTSGRQVDVTDHVLFEWREGNVAPAPAICVCHEDADPPILHFHKPGQLKWLRLRVTLPPADDLDRLLFVRLVARFTTAAGDDAKKAGGRDRIQLKTNLLSRTPPQAAMSLVPLCGSQVEVRTGDWVEMSGIFAGLPLPGATITYFALSLPDDVVVDLAALDTAWFEAEVSDSPDGDALAAMGAFQVHYGDAPAILLNADVDTSSHVEHWLENLAAGAAAAASERWGEVDFAQPLNIAYFWKQNDSGLYGRRQDMLVKYLARSGRVGTIVHFDAPIGISQLQQTADVQDKAHQGPLVARNTMERFFNLQDEAGILRRVFVHEDGDGATGLGRSLPKLSRYGDFVLACLAEAGITGNLIAIVCPAQFDLPDMLAGLAFPVVAADVIDNQLAWPVGRTFGDRLSANYAAVLGMASAVIANCETVGEAMLDYADRIDIIPNGAEIFPDDQVWVRPELYRTFDGPVIGYAGNLRNRVRFDLIEALAAAHPDWHIVLIGSAHDNPDVRDLAAHANIHVLGVIPYDEALHHIAQFDAAIMPHEAGVLTDAMNPLKLYVYAAVGVPIVTTAVANIDDLRGHIRVALTDDDFRTQVEAAVADKQSDHFRPVPTEVLERVSWPRRVEELLASIESQVRGDS